MDNLFTPNLVKYTTNENDDEDVYNVSLTNYYIPKSNVNGSNKYVVNTSANGGRSSSEFLNATIDENNLKDKSRTNIANSLYSGEDNSVYGVSDAGNYNRIDLNNLNTVKARNSNMKRKLEMSNDVRRTRQKTTSSGDMYKSTFLTQTNKYQRESGIHQLDRRNGHNYIYICCMFRMIKLYYTGLKLISNTSDEFVKNLQAKFPGNQLIAETRTSETRTSEPEPGTSQSAGGGSTGDVTGIAADVTETSVDVTGAINDVTSTTGDVNNTSAEGVNKLVNDRCKGVANYDNIELVLFVGICNFRDNRYGRNLKSKSNYKLFNTFVAKNSSASNINLPNDVSGYVVTEFGSVICYLHRNKQADTKLYDLKEKTIVYIPSDNASECFMELKWNNNYNDKLIVNNNQVILNLVSDWMLRYPDKAYTKDIFTKALTMNLGYEMFKSKLGSNLNNVKCYVDRESNFKLSIDNINDVQRVIIPKIICPVQFLYDITDIRRNKKRDIQCDYDVMNFRSKSMHVEVNLPDNDIYDKLDIVQDNFVILKLLTTSLSVVLFDQPFDFIFYGAYSGKSSSKYMDNQPTRYLLNSNEIYLDVTDKLQNERKQQLQKEHKFIDRLSKQIINAYDSYRDINVYKTILETRFLRTNNSNLGKIQVDSYKILQIEDLKETYKLENYHYSNKSDTKLNFTLKFNKVYQTSDEVTSKIQVKSITENVNEMVNYVVLQFNLLSNLIYLRYELSEITETDA